MKYRRSFWIAALLVTPPLGLIVTPPAHAQQNVSAPINNTQDEEAPLSDKRPRPLGDILRRMSRTAGVQIVADNRTAKLLVPPPAEATTPENYEAQITALTKALPSGTTWGKLMLPERKGRWDGDAVAEYALAEARLFGHVGEKTRGDEVEILGQHLSRDKAEVHISGLNLTPIYLITNGSARAGMADPNQWANMTPEQKREYARQQASQLANTDPALRNAIAQQYFMVFNALLVGLPQGDRQALFAGIGGPGQNVRVSVRAETTGPNGPATVKPENIIVVSP